MAESKQYAYADLPSKRMLLSGLELLHNTRYNKGTAFSLAERKMLHLEGLLPPCVTTQEEQADRILHQLDEAANDLQRYNILSNLEGRNRRLFYYVVINNVERCLPLVYTPTVGLACQNFGDLYQQSRGLYISLQDRGRIRDLLRNWREEQVKAIVFTDGERILGLGDLGASGMGIPLGKMALYTALGGVNPDHCLPITLDTGTNNEKFLAHPLYRGLRQRRARGKDYDDFVEEFMTSAQAEFGETVLLQFEDFANENAFRLLAKYQDRCTTFNDDIQGTAAVVTAGVIAAIPQSKLSWRQHRFLFYGAGSAGIGICELIVTAMVKATGCTEAEARGQIWLVDSKGLVFKGRKSGGINGEKEPYAHVWAAAEALGGKNQPLEVYVKDLGITGIFGVSAQPQTFTEPTIRQLTANCPVPIVFALSNPTSKSECTAEQAYSWSDGKALFASGSPFPNYKHTDGTIRVPGQGNNCYIFPGVGLGIVLTGARRVRNKVFLAAAETLAAQVTEEDLAVGCLYPSMKRVREVSARIAATVAADVYDDGLETIYPRPADLYQYCLERMWVSEYQHYA